VMKTIGRCHFLCVQMYNDSFVWISVEGENPVCGLLYT
jgi:hypothetical protein